MNLEDRFWKKVDRKTGIRGWKPTARQSFWILFTLFIGTGFLAMLASLG